MTRTIPPRSTTSFIESNIPATAGQYSRFDPDTSMDDVYYSSPGSLAAGFDLPQKMPGQNPQFLQWLFNFKKQVTTPLRNLWRGMEEDEFGKWHLSASRLRVMNENGVTWCISLIESYINPVYIVSNYSEKDMNWTMRQAGRVVYNNLCARYSEFGMNKLDIPRVGNEIISKIHAVLLGARNNGYRQFFSSTHTTQEITSDYHEPPNKGFMPQIRGLFGWREQ